MLVSIVIISIIFLMRWAYSAYRWDESLISLDTIEHVFQMSSHWASVNDEEEKVRTLASMIPLVGIWIAARYPSTPTLRGRIVGSALFFMYIISLWLTWAESLLSFLILIAAILLFVVKGVYIFLYDRSIEFDLFEKLPSYDQVHSAIIASVESLFEFFRIAFGGHDRVSWMTFFERENTREDGERIEESYFMPPNLLGIPFFNLFGLPSLFIEQYRPYRKLVLEWLMITLLWVYVFFFLHSYSHPLLLLSLFPIVHILVSGASEKGEQTPWLSLITRVLENFGSLSTELQNAQKQSKEESYTYKTE